jgi:hypothetical protein
MRKTMLLALAAFAGALWAGGFYLQLGNPEANPEAKKLNAVLVVKAWGCHDPSTATLTARAIGTSGGERREIPLRVEKLSEAGAFALLPVSLKTGHWVIELVARQGDMLTTTLVPAGQEGIDRTHAKSMTMKTFAPADVEAMLER